MTGEAAHLKFASEVLVNAGYSTWQVDDVLKGNTEWLELLSASTMSPLLKRHLTVAGARHGKKLQEQIVANIGEREKRCQK